MRSSTATVATRVVVSFGSRGAEFSRLASSHAGSVAGDALVALALAGTLFFSVPSTEARQNMALYLLLTLAPFAVIGPMLGGVYQRFPAAYRSGLVASSALRVLLAVAMTVFGPPVPVNRVSTTTAGIASGALGTATAIGGPPLALLYQHHEGPVLRATLAVAFAFGTVLSLIALAITGAIEPWHVALAAALLPGLLAGLVVSRLVIGRLDQSWLRPAVLTFAAATAVIGIVRGITG